MTRVDRGERDDFRVTARGRDRRFGFGELLVALSRVLTDRADISLMRGAFEEMLRRMVPVQSVRLRSTGPGSRGRIQPEDGLESVAFDVPAASPGAGGVLEATFVPGSRLGEWDFQMLAAAAHLGSLVLELERCRLQQARSGLSLAPRTRREASAPLVGTTAVMRELRSRIERVAQTDFIVLLEGESGVGKELVARQIHELSRRAAGPFVAINCAALVETLLEAELFGIEERTATGVRGRRGKFEHADGGTLFLDEVSDLSPSAQAKLLRAIQDLAVERVGGNGVHHVDIRIVAATNRSLAELVDLRLFRRDLFYRLGGIDIRVPALRERREDVLELARHFLDRHQSAGTMRLSESAADALVAYDWPGNVRELERLIERAVALSEGTVIEIEHLPPVVRGDYEAKLLPSVRRNESMREWSSRYARLILDRCGGNKRHASRVLGISYHTLGAYLKRVSSNEQNAGSDVLNDEPAAADSGASSTDPGPPRCAVEV
jgi:two-component system response regulator HydG